VQIDTSAHLRRDVDALAQLADRAPLDAAVPSCPGWTLRDLLHHVGTIHRWATEIVRTGVAHDEPPGSGPQEAGELSSWLREGGEALAEVLEATDPDGECWTLGFPPARAGFWRVRQALETSLHRGDAHLAVGEPWAMPAELAAVGIDEVVDFFLPRQIGLGRIEPLADPVDLVATDLSRTWTLPGVQPDARPAAQLRGTAPALYLWLWGRSPAEGLEVDGDDAAIEAAARTALTP